MPKPTNRSTKRRTRSSRPAQREAWLRQIAPASLFHALFDHLPGLHFFAKNRRGETMFASSSVRKLYDLRGEADVIGLTDFDLNPPVMAKGYVADDARIYRTGEPVLRHVELWWDARGIPDWYQVTKLPIRSRRGAIIGIMGVLQRYEGAVHLAILPRDAPERRVAGRHRHRLRLLRPEFLHRALPPLRGPDATGVPALDGG